MSTKRWLSFSGFVFSSDAA